MVRGYDYLVIGAGILGLTTAYYIKKLNPSADVCIVDMLADAGQGNTARSVGGFRRGIFTSYVNRVLVETSIDYYMDVEKSGEYSFGMRFIGYLILLTESRLREIGSYVESFVKQGKVKLLGKEELEKRLGMKTGFSGDEEAEMLEMEDIKYGMFAPECGQMDVEKLIAYYKNLCIDSGIEIIFNKRVNRLVLSPKTPLGIPDEPRVWQSKKISGVETDGEVITAENLVVAAGVWTPELLDPLGVDCLVKPKKRQLAVVRTSTSELRDLLTRGGLNNENTLPMIFFPKGLYLVPRREESCFWIGLTDDIGRRFGIDMEPEERFYYDHAHPMLAKYFREFANARPENMWAGCYAMNMLDGNPVIFRFLNCTVVTGASGSGAMKADAIGRIAASTTLGKRTAILYNMIPFDVSLLDIQNRRVDKEYLIL